MKSNIAVISSEKNIHFAKYIANKLYKYYDVKIIIPISSDENYYVDSIDSAIVLMDKSFSDNVFLKQVVNHYMNFNLKITPILLDDSPIPDEFKCFRVFKSKTTEDLNSIIEEFISYKPKKRNFLSKNFSFIYACCCIEVLAISSMLFLFFGNDILGDSNVLFIYITIFSVFAAMATAIFSFAFLIKSKNSEEESKSRQIYDKKLDNIIKEKTVNNGEKEFNKKKELDAIEQMKINLSDIKEYYEWSHKQARFSFALAFSLCIFGFLLMVASFVVPIVCKLGFQVSLISVIGSITVEFIAGTALIVYKSSLLQLNHYHKSLHEDERFLSSVNLLEKFDTMESKEEMLKEIIKSELKMNIDANLINKK